MWEGLQKAVKSGGPNFILIAKGPESDPNLMKHCAFKLCGSEVYMYWFP
jgi:hypothetical protein